jgi:hypothetical protein
MFHMLDSQPTARVTRVLRTALGVTRPMRSEYGRVLRLSIERGLNCSAFGWQSQKIESPYVFPGERVFSKLGTDRLLWCALVVHERFEKFTFEVGWSLQCRFPELKVRPSLQSPVESQHLSEYMVRLGRLIDDADRWWEVESFTGASTLHDLVKTTQAISPAIARSKVEPVAASALAALETHAVPFLEAVCKVHR